MDGSELGCYKISAAGDCGYLAHRDLRVSHALYSTCAEYNSQHSSGDDAALTLGDMLRNSRINTGELTSEIISRANGCPIDKILKTSIPEFDKLFTFTDIDENERAEFGIYITGMKNFNRKGVTHNPPENIKDAVFAGTHQQRNAQFPTQRQDSILLSTLNQYLQETYRVATVIIVDYSCRWTSDELVTHFGRAMSNEHITNTPMETDDTPTRVRPLQYRCPHPCPICNTFGEGGKLLKNNKKSRISNKKNKKKKSKGRSYK